MKLRLLASLVVALTFFSISAKAQDTDKADVFLGYDYTRISGGINANGGVGQVAFNFNDTLGVVASISGVEAHGGTAYTYLFGPRISYHHSAKVSPFVDVLFGGVHLSGGGASTNGYAMALGGGLDYKVTQHVAIRPVQMDYLYVHSAGRGTNNFSYAAGVDFRF